MKKTKNLESLKAELFIGNNANKVVGGILNTWHSCTSAKCSSPSGACISGRCTIWEEIDHSKQLLE